MTERQPDLKVTEGRNDWLRNEALISATKTILYIAINFARHRYLEKHHIYGSHRAPLLLQSFYGSIIMLFIVSN